MLGAAVLCKNIKKHDGKEIKVRERERERTDSPEQVMTPPMMPQRRVRKARKDSCLSLTSTLRAETSYLKKIPGVPCESCWMGGW